MLVWIRGAEELTLISIFTRYRFFVRVLQKLLSNFSLQCLLVPSKRHTNQSVPGFSYGYLLLKCFGFLSYLLGASGIAVDGLA